MRENVKSRPEFATDLTEYKDTIRNFYKEEQSTRKYLPDYEGYDWKQLSKTTHLEPFTWPVWEEERIAEYSDRGGRRSSRAKDTGRKTVSFVLFDYRKRNPLNYGASTRVLLKMNWNISAACNINLL